MRLIGAKRHVPAEGVDALAGRSHYFIGNDPKDWRTNIPTFGRVQYDEVYPGIAVVYHGNQRQLEYDFIVAPHHSADAIELAFNGADRVELTEAGDLLVQLGGRVLRQAKPLVYQEVAGARHVVDADYVLNGAGRVGFAIAGYDAELPLIIDPVLAYSTYLGGSGDDIAQDIAVDSSGSVYICGETTSTNFPTANPIQGTFAGGTFVGARDGFVAKLNAAGTALVYSTYLGGAGPSGVTNGDDRCFGIALDPVSGGVVVVGETHSSDFPLANAFQSTYGGGFSDAFVTKLNADGSALVYSTFVGGDVFDAAAGVALDSSGVYITGRTTSDDFPMVNPIQSSRGGDADGFITKINAAGSALVYSSYLGGDDFDAGASIALDGTSNAYLTGQTRSTNFPVANAIQATFGGGTPDGDAFVTKVNSAGSALVYSTYVGGSDNDPGFDIAVDTAGNAYITGNTFSTDFPTANSLQATLSGTNDGFVTKLNAAGTAFVFSTYLGGTNGDSGNDIAVDSSGQAHIAGGTDSTDFPTVNAVQSTTGGNVDAFITKLNAAGSALIYSSYVGGGTFDRANAIALDGDGNAYVAGVTDSTNYPLANALQATAGGANDAFVFKLSEATPATVEFSSSRYRLLEKQGPVVLTLQRTGTQTTAATVHFETSPGTALAGSDYTTTSGDVTFAANGTNTETISIPITNDHTPEGTETFQVTLTAGLNAVIGGQGTATVKIFDRDGPPPTVQFSEMSYQVVEKRDHVVLRVERNGNRGDAITVHFATSDKTAHAGSDYVATSGDVTFPAGGAATATISIPLMNDHIPESDKTFKVTLTPSASAGLGPQKTATVTIIDKD